MVVNVIEKTKAGQAEQRKKYRDEVYNKNKEDLEDPEIQQKIQEKAKLYAEVARMRKDIKLTKMKLTTYGTEDKIEQEKSKHKQKIEENYELYEEIKSLQKIKKQQKKAIIELQATDPDTHSRTDENKAKITSMSIEEKKRYLALSETAKEIDKQLQQKLIENSKIIEDSKKLKEALKMLEKGKKVKDKKDIKEESERNHLKMKLESLAKILKAKRSKHKSDLKVISNKYRQVVKTILGCKVSFEEAVQESDKKSRCVLQLKNMAGLSQSAKKKEELLE